MADVEELDKELLNAYRESMRRRKAEQDALDAEAKEEGPGFLSRLALGLGAGYAASQAGGDAGKMVNDIYSSAAKEREAERNRRIKAIEGYDSTLKGLNELYKTRAGEKKDFAKQDRQFAHDEKMAKLKAGEKQPEQILNRASVLRKEYTGLPTTKATQDTAASIERIRQSYDNPSAAGDLALIFNYMKMLDPGSTVREGEFANAQNAASVPDRIRNQYNRIMSGERLNNDQRKDFAFQSERQYQAQLNAQKTFTDHYTNLARQYGIDPSQVLFQFPGPRSYDAPKPPLAGEDSPGGNNAYAGDGARIQRNKRTGAIRKVYPDGRIEMVN